MQVVTRQAQLLDETKLVRAYVGVLVLELGLHPTRALLRGWLGEVRRWQRGQAVAEVGEVGRKEQGQGVGWDQAKLTLRFFQAACAMAGFLLDAG